MKKITLLTITYSLLTLLAGCGAQSTQQTQATNFQECENWGWVIMESYPRQCKLWEQTFTEKLQIKVENTLKNYKYGVVNRIEDGRDGKQVYISLNGYEYNTAISTQDAILNWSLEDIVLGTRIKIFYEDMVEDSNLLIGHWIEIVSQGLSQNDISLYLKLKHNVSQEYQEKINKEMFDYLNEIDSITNARKIEKTNKLVKALDEHINALLSKYPQDTALPTDINEQYQVLQLNKFELMNLDFGKDFIIGWNTAKEIVKEEGLTMLGQNHNLIVTMVTEKGNRYVTREAKIDDYMKLKDICGEKCKDLVFMTE